MNYIVRFILLTVLIIRSKWSCVHKQVTVACTYCLLESILILHRWTISIIYQKSCMQKIVFTWPILWHFPVFFVFHQKGQAKTLHLLVAVAAANALNPNVCWHRVLTLLYTLNYGMPFLATPKHRQDAPQTHSYRLQSEDEPSPKDEWMTDLFMRGIFCFKQETIQQCANLLVVAGA